MQQFLQVRYFKENGGNMSMILCYIWNIYPFKFTLNQSVYL